MACPKNPFFPHHVVLILMLIFAPDALPLTLYYVLVCRMLLGRFLTGGLS